MTRFVLRKLRERCGSQTSNVIAKGHWFEPRQYPKLGFLKQRGQSAVVLLFSQNSSLNCLLIVRNVTDFSPSHNPNCVDCWYWRRVRGDFPDYWLFFSTLNCVKVILLFSYNKGVNVQTAADLTNRPHVHKWRRICYSYFRPTTCHQFGLNILLNFAHGTKVRGAC